MKARILCYVICSSHALCTIVFLALIRTVVLKDVSLVGPTYLPTATSLFVDRTYFWYTAVLVVLVAGIAFGEKVGRSDVITCCIGLVLTVIVGMAGLLALLAFMPA